MATTRKYIEAGKGSYSLWGWAWDNAEEGGNLRPSREPPFDCALGRLLSKGKGSTVKPPGSFRRPFLCLSYVTEAPRHPSGTLKNKVAPQATRALCLGYVGGRSGNFETLGMDHTQAGYACLIPGEQPGGDRVVVTSDVSFVPSCRPGLQRSTRGGWTIPENALHKQNAEPVASNEAPIKDVTDNDFESHVPTEHTPLDLVRGFPPDAKDHDADKDDGDDVAPGRGGEQETDLLSAKTLPKPARFIVPRDHWPDDPCTEYDGKGWEVEIVKREHNWVLCKFVSARDNDGRPFANEWRRKADLLAIPEPTETVASDAVAPPQPLPKEVTSAPTRMPEGNIVPNANTLPAPGSDDPLREPARPTRATRPPDRLAYSAAALSAAYAEAAGVGFDLKAPRMTDAAFLVNTDHGADRLVARAFDQAAARGEPLLVSVENDIRSSFDEMVPELQRAALIAADIDLVSAELGPTSPQAKMARELYAAAAVDAAMLGVRVPMLEPHAQVDGDLSDTGSVPLTDIFDDQNSGRLFLCNDTGFGTDIFALSKAKTAPDIFSERQMRGPDWDTPKQMEVAKIERLEAKMDIAADDPKVKGMPVCEMLWTGRCKRNPDGSIDKMNARCCARGDLDKQRLGLTSNDNTSPVARTSSMMCFDAVCCLRAQHKCSYDVPGAYLQGEQLPSEQRLYRPPPGFRSWDERGVEILWLSLSPFYGQTNAGAIWNRTVNHSLTSDEQPHGCGFERCPADPSVYGVNVSDGALGGQVSGTLYVDDGRWAWDPAQDATPGKDAKVSPAETKIRDTQKKMTDKYGIKFGPDDPPETHFLGANIYSAPSRCVTTVSATSYIDLMVKRFADGDVSSPKFPSHWSSIPADDTLVKAWESAMATRTPASEKLTKEYGSLFGAVLHATKYRPEISAAMGLLGSCLTFPTPALLSCLMHVLVYLGRSRKMGTTFSSFVPGARKLRAFADSSWNITRSVTGWMMVLAGATICAASRRQHCITMSSCEAELVALADCAIELLHIIQVLEFLGYDVEDAVEVCTDSKAAYDLCHRFTSAQNSRHVDRKMFKMRELRGSGRVVVRHIPGETNPADLFTKVLSRQPFEKHRKFVLNLPAGRDAEYSRRSEAWPASSQREGTGAK